MAQFDVHRMPNGALVVDCQNASLDFLATRVVVPLFPVNLAPTTKDRLHSQLKGASICLPFTWSPPYPAEIWDPPFHPWPANTMPLLARSIDC